MSNWTKGPWEIGDENDACCDINIGETSASLCRENAMTGCRVISREEMLANARLIAAAPDLVEAVRQFVNGMDLYERGIYLSQKDQDAIIAHARSALVKAGVA